MLDAKELFSLVVQVDSVLIKKGIAPHARPLAACQEIADAKGIAFVLAGHIKDPLVEGVHSIYRQLYRHSDLVMPPMHVGAFMFRDVFFPVSESQSAMGRLR